MAEREFEICISPGGEVECLIKGYKGKRCHDAVKLLEEMVGQVKSQQATSEFYEPEEYVQYSLEQRHGR
jgi:hypothetical protein